MPVYVYKCAECGTDYEKLRGINQSDSELECPHCGQSGRAKRKLATFAAFSKTDGITRPSNQSGGNTGGGCQMGKGGPGCGCHGGF
jgi:putative FmdB family regulatory protein